MINKKPVLGNYCTIEGEDYYIIENVNEMRPFFMSIVSATNHWMFISSNGALSAGRKNADYALFPYYTDDKITDLSESTGCKSLFIVSRDNKKNLWEPFSEKYEGIYDISRNLYKNTYGNKILFEEINHDLGITFRYQWNSSDQYGFIRKSTLINQSSEEIKISILDGLQHIMPCGVPASMQNSTSNLVDAYKRSELAKTTGMGIFALSAVIVDKAEPSEALKANIVWSLGLENPTYLLSSIQLKDFRKGLPIHEETDIKGEKGAYFIHSDITLQPGKNKEWVIIANVNQNHSSIVNLSERIAHGTILYSHIQKDIDEGTNNLKKMVASSDGLQLTADKLKDTRHFSNTLFNIMRGGIFNSNYQIEKKDFIDYLTKADKAVIQANYTDVEKLPVLFDLQILKETSNKTEDADFKRLCLEYLPLYFSRRHGDPTRPWNQFSINTHNDVDGSKIFDYQGNWRDIFQNWEALAHAYPEFTMGMIHKFLNASTFDGYNPYRVTKDGFDWETIEPGNPWSYIGYWGDHQIIYLLKLLEIVEAYHPGQLEFFFDKNIFVYANVPYRIKSYSDILKNPKDTIVFEEKSGRDAVLLTDQKEEIYHVNFVEKILATLLAKMSNFIPEGGIWMNTQRPEWNDANNALVGNGVSMVTTYYLRRFLHFFKEIFASAHCTTISLSKELAACFQLMADTLEQNIGVLSHPINDAKRKQILDGLAQPASDYRRKIYEQSFSGDKTNVALDDLKAFVNVSLHYLDHSIRANKREDDLYHAYNLMSLNNECEVTISHLIEMLEGQVAVLSSGYLSAEESVALLESLKRSKLFREDQYSYLLYPNKELPKFLEKNNIPEHAVSRTELMQRLVSDGNTQIVEKDVTGRFHFNANFKNANDLKAALENLSGYESLVKQDFRTVLDIYEEIFNHKAFTGRSGTFYAYEGLGSIYWHMVSKLQLAVQECYFNAIKNGESKTALNRLSYYYYDINQGIGVHKSPLLYGAFPTDPYSHTPAGKGAKQPGMTGQVKEDILCRFGELGVFVKEGKMAFTPALLQKEAFLKEKSVFRYINVNAEAKEIEVEAHSLCFTYCQVPILYEMGAEPEHVAIRLSGGEVLMMKGLRIDEKTSLKIFERTGEVEQVTVYFHVS